MAPSMACDAAGSFARQSPTRIVSAWSGGDGSAGNAAGAAGARAAALPPFTLVHGTEDGVVPPASSRRFAASLVR